MLASSASIYRSPQSQRIAAEIAAVLLTARKSAASSFIQDAIPMLTAESSISWRVSLPDSSTHLMPPCIPSRSGLMAGLARGGAFQEKDRHVQAATDIFLGGFLAVWTRYSTSSTMPSRLRPVPLFEGGRPLRAGRATERAGFCRRYHVLHRALRVVMRLQRWNHRICWTHGDVLPERPRFCSMAFTMEHAAHLAIVYSLWHGVGYMIGSLLLGTVAYNAAFRLGRRW